MLASLGPSCSLVPPRLHPIRVPLRCRRLPRRKHSVPSYESLPEARHARLPCPPIPIATPLFPPSGGTTSLCLTPAGIARETRETRQSAAWWFLGACGGALSHGGSSGAHGIRSCPLRVGWTLTEPQVHAGGKRQPGRLQQSRRWRQPRSSQERAVVPWQLAQALRGRAYEILQVLEQRAFGRRSLIALPARKGRRSAVLSGKPRGCSRSNTPSISARAPLCVL